MALYIPAGRRRRRAIGLIVAAFVVGLVAGWIGGRASSPSVEGRVKSVRSEARQTAAGLRVVALHDQTGAVAQPTPGDAGTDLVLRRTRTELDHEFRRAPWVTRQQHDQLLRELDALQARPDRGTAAFGAAAEALARDIETTFGTNG
ncbi:MAG: hypothetical protein JWO37_1423 [Acidimicrobiales bacterium]|nr:hypothetical protein [Acidimicrobiales bacterium]